MGTALKWSQEFELGYEKIDTEHRVLFELVVDFHEAAAQGASKEKLCRILNEIVKYAEFYFVSEENVMAEHQYSAQNQHAFLHSVLLAEIKDTSNRFQQDGIEADDVFKFLYDWFTLHTSHEDKKLVGYLGK